MSDAQTLKHITGTIALAGAGKMGGAMLSGWLAQGLDAARVVVIEPAPSPEISALAKQGVRLNPSAKDAGAITALVIAVKPQSFREAGASLKPFSASSTLVVSIMAGTTIASLEEVCGGNVVRAMPNTPASIGRGITVAVAAKKVSAAQRSVTCRIAADSNNVSDFSRGCVWSRWMNLSCLPEKKWMSICTLGPSCRLWPPRPLVPT